VGADLPNRLLPLQPQDGQWADLEPLAPVDWQLPAVVNWLNQTGGLPPEVQTLPPLARGVRVHIALDEQRQARDGHFYCNEILDFSRPLDDRQQAMQGLWMRISAPCSLPKNSPDLATALQRFSRDAWRLGADGGMAAWRPVDSATGISVLKSLAQPLAEAARENRLAGRTLVLYLASPACFGRNGWYPDGFKPATDAPADSLQGSPVGFPAGWRFELSAAAVPGWQAQSNLKRLHDTAQPAALRKDAVGDTAPTAIRRTPSEKNRRLGTLNRLVPAGSLYWLKVLEQGPAVDWDALMLTSCCRVEHARDGLGLALYALDRQN
jgi:hypothetical protein